MADALDTTHGFDKDKLYRPKDPEMRQIASESQLAQWRHYQRGLPFSRIGQNVYYSGADIIRYLRENRVEPQSQAA